MLVDQSDHLLLVIVPVIVSVSGHASLVLLDAAQLVIRAGRCREILALERLAFALLANRCELDLVVGLVVG